MLSLGVHPFTLPLFLSAILLGGIAYYAYRQLSPGSNLFALVALAVSIYAGGYGFELASSDLSWILFWVNVEYIGIVSIPVLLLLFTLVYTEQNQWVSRRSVFLLFIIPVLSLLLVWTNQWHLMFYSSTNIVQENGFILFAPKQGIGYWVNIGYAYFLLAVTIFLIIRAYSTTTFLYRRQLSVLFAGILIPWLGDIFKVFVLQFETYLDFAPILFTMSGVVMAVGLFRYRLLDLMPVARSKLVEMTQDTWIVLDANNRFIDLNTAAELIFGKKRNQLIGTQIHTVLPKDHALLVCLQDSRQHRAEIELLDDDLNLSSFDVRLSVLTDWRRRPSGRLVVLYDVTKQKTAERTLRTLNSQLEMAVEARTAEIQAEKERVEAILQTVKKSHDQFIANISHELRTPMTNLKLYLSLLSYTPLSEKGEQYQTILQEEVARLEKLAQGVVALARLDSKESLDSSHPLALKTVTKLALDGLASIIEKQHLTVDLIGFDDSMPTIQGEPIGVQQAVGELIKNAVAFSPEHEEIRITIGQVEQAGQTWVTLSIANKGPSISEDEHDKIFERFYRGTAVSHGTTPGLGIGLSLVRQIMKLHGGRVAVTSSPQEGNIFTLWFKIDLEKVVG